MMTAVFAEHELVASCRVLFGAELDVSRSFLEYLQRSGIKSAYRKKALETHPDVLISHGDNAAAKSADLFRRVQQAYENLNAYLDARDNGFRFPAARPRTQAAPPCPPQPKPAPRPEQRWSSAAGQGNARPHKARPSSGQPGGFTRTKARTASSAWQGNGQTTGRSMTPGAIPSRKLLFGHYLYYAGVANWQTIVKALVWQRTGRPRLGEIGRRFGWLSDEDVLTVLKKRKLSDSFGASAVALGFISEAQLRLMLFQQSKLQKRFGEYFVQHNLLTAFQIDELVKHCARHNTAFEQRRSFAFRM